MRPYLPQQRASNCTETLRCGRHTGRDLRLACLKGRSVSE
jgi:hypothetical protein